MNDREFINNLIKVNFSNATNPYQATINNAIVNRLNDIADKLDKYKEHMILEEQVSCPLDALFVGIKAVKNGIYAIDLPNENKIKYIPTLTLSNVGTEWYLSNHCDFCVNVRDYKELFWFKEDKSE